MAMHMPRLFDTSLSEAMIYPTGFTSWYFHKAWLEQSLLRQWSQPREKITQVKSIEKKGFTPKDYDLYYSTGYSTNYRRFALLQRGNQTLK